MFLWMLNKKAIFREIAKLFLGINFYSTLFITVFIAYTEVDSVIKLVNEIIKLWRDSDIENMCGLWAWWK